MFDKETVFVLGAGASWHYCYPTGEELVLDIIEMAKSLQAECKRQLQGPYQPGIPNFVTPQDRRSRVIYWQGLSEQCGDLIQRLEAVRPVVIDYFLGWNPSLREIGRLLIAAVILKCEAAHHDEKANINRRPIAERAIESPTLDALKRINISAYKDNWYRFVTHRIASKCLVSKDLHRNAVHFVTFNYDYSLESHLIKSLNAIDTFDEPDVHQFVAERVVHVYGCIRDSVPQEFELKENGHLSNALYLGDDSYFEESKWIPFLENAHRAGEKIRTIDNHDKVHEPFLARAQAWIKQAEIGYLLGYGFDEENNRRIGLEELVRIRSGVHVYFTNFKNANAVNKRIGVMAGNYRMFLDEFIIGAANGTIFEKSERDVYEALELDFGSFY